MQGEIARLYAVIGANIDELQAKLGEAGGDLRRFSQEAEGHAAGGESFFNRMAAAAAGFLSARLLEQIGSKLWDVAQQAIGATAQLQMMEVGITGLLAREISKGETITETFETVQRVGLGSSATIAKLVQQQESLTAKLYDYQNQQAIANQRLAEYSAKGKVAESTMMSARYTVEKYNASIAKTQGELDAVNAKLEDSRVGHMAVVEGQRQVRVGAMAMADAYPIAADRAKQLTEQLAKIAIFSPYQLNIVQSTFKTAMAFGYSSKEAIDYTKALLNVAAGMGSTNEQLQRMSYNFSQIRMVGQVTKMDIRQLAMAGFDLVSVLQFAGEKFGVMIKDHEDFNKAIEEGKITWEMFTEAFAEYADVNFGGAAERLSTTLMGLQSTFADIFALTFPKLLMPGMEAVNVRLSNMLNLFLAIRESGTLDEMGEKLGEKLNKALGPLDRVLQKVERFQQLQREQRENAKAMMDPRMYGGLADSSWAAEMQQISGGLGTGGVIIKALLGEDRGTYAIRMITRARTLIGDIRSAVKGFVSGESPYGPLGALGVPEWIIDRLVGLRGAVADAGLTVRMVIDQIKEGDWEGAWNTLVTGATTLWEKRIKPEIATIGSKIEAEWPAIQAQLQALVTKGWYELEKLWNGETQPDALGAPIRIPGLRERAQAFAKTIWDGLWEGATDVAAIADTLTTKLNDLVVTGDVATVIETVGMAVGSFIAKGIARLFGEDAAQQETQSALETHLLNVIENVGSTAVFLGGQLAISLISGLAGKLAGTDPANISAMLQTIIGDPQDTISIALGAKLGSPEMGQELASRYIKLWQNEKVGDATRTAAWDQAHIWMDRYGLALDENSNVVKTKAETIGTDVGEGMADKWMTALTNGMEPLYPELETMRQRIAAILDNIPINFTINAPGMADFIKARTGQDVSEYYGDPTTGSGQSLEGVMDGVVNGLDGIRRGLPQGVASNITVLLQGSVIRPEDARRGAKIGVAEALRAAGRA